MKIINNNRFTVKSTPLNVMQLFQLEAISHHYENLKELYINSTSRTRNKSIPLPKIRKNISTKNSYVIAIKIYNDLTDDLKIMDSNNSNKKRKLKKFILDWTC